MLSSECLSFKGFNLLRLGEFLIEGLENQTDLFFPAYTMILLEIFELNLKDSEMEDQEAKNSTGVKDGHRQSFKGLKVRVILKDQ